MSNRGDDCYFFYYSTCTKGDGCPFRHCEAAMGSEAVCNLWEEGRCFRTTCKFRHMAITKRRKEILCYWESQADGCQKPHCAFFHERPRCIEGLYVPADKTSQSQNTEQPSEEPAPATTTPPLPNAPNPQLRSVIKAESQEPVPSPTHPPVVINPADDDEDEDDQFSEEGDDGRFGISSRKLHKSGDSMNFGVSTLEEIRLRKALKASMKRAGYPLQNADATASGEKENANSSFRPRDDTARPRGGVGERLGRKTSGADEQRAEGVRPKRSLSERLGRVVDRGPPQKVMKPIKERLGLSAGSVAARSAVETNTESKKTTEQIRIKTLDEIKLEKAAKSRSLSKGGGPSDASGAVGKAKPTKGVKRTVRDQASTFAKKERREEVKLAEPTAEKALNKSRGESDPAGHGPGPGPGPEAANPGEVRVKTLEEIRREKAERLPVQQPSEDPSKKSSDGEESKPRLPPLLRPAPQAEEDGESTEKPVKPQTAAPKSSVANGSGIKVKTFEEIMREKRLRRQETEKAKGPAEAEPCQKPPAEGTLKRRFPAAVRLTPPGSSSPDSAPPAQEVPVHKTRSLRSTAASPPSSDTTPGAVGDTVASAKPSSSPTESDSPGAARSKKVPPKTARKSKQTRTAARSPAAEANGTPNKGPKKSPEHTPDTKVRPKLNVKPSVMKPAVRVKPGQKRRGAGRSAVAAVKPLNSASAGLEEQLQEATCGNAEVFRSTGAEAQLSPAVPRSPVAALDLSSSPPSDELQTVPVFKQSVIVAAARETVPAARSPVLKTPPPSKSRRTSVAASRTASSTTSAAAATTVDVFDELINEFTDEHLQDGDVDAEIGEDDLLQELSEMIDS
ncbi:zinc finger CCCH domain-containing protein 11A-like [Brachionichthys hirsutus]|uniref:zinc finger CCCH domain-containing protein 11A-like n=1 Tax=Brachionichthys hirsutus TaxID=412623 RepID=UPI00360542D9